MDKQERCILQGLQLMNPPELVALIGEQPAKVLLLRSSGMSLTDISFAMGGVGLPMTQKLYDLAIVRCRYQLWWAVFSTRTAECLLREGFESLEQVAEALRAGEITQGNANNFLYKGRPIAEFGKHSLKEICTQTGVTPSWASRSSDAWWNIFTTRTAKCLLHAGFESLEQVAEALRSGEIAPGTPRGSGYRYQGEHFQNFGETSFQEVCEKTKGVPQKLVA